MSLFPPSSPTAHPEPLQAIACPACFGAVAVGPDLLGRAAECPLCGSGFRVPAAGAPVDPQPRPFPPADERSSPPHRRRRPKREFETLPSAPREASEPASQRSTFPYDPPRAAEPEPAPSQEPVDGEPPAEPERSAEMQLQEPVRTIVSGDRVVTLHRLSPEERSIRRARRNVVMLLTGVSLLMAIVLLLGRKRQRRRSRQ
ncbi:MAG: hypothetical protein ACKOWG_00290 [Planctomycetia bacterium]